MSQQSPLPLAGISLLDCLTRDALQHHTSRTSRILITGMIPNPNNAPLVQRVITEFAAQHAQDESEKRATEVDGSQAADEANATAAVSALTGVVLLINSVCFQGFIETSSESIFEFIRYLDTRLCQTAACDIKVLSFCEAVPRAFTLFASRMLRSTVSEEWPNPSPSPPLNLTSPPMPPHTPSPLLQLTFSTLHSMLALASHLSTLPDEERMDFVTASSSRHLLERVCPVQRIEGFSSSDELMSATEFMEAFNDPITVKNERDDTWPVERQDHIIV